MANFLQWTRKVIAGDGSAAMAGDVLAEGRPLLATFQQMVRTGEIDASDAEEHFREILARARI